MNLPVLQDPRSAHWTHLDHQNPISIGMPRTRPPKLEPFQVGIQGKGIACKTQVGKSHRLHSASVGTLQCHQHGVDTGTLVDAKASFLKKLHNLYL
eukprot:5629327-Amphidinium_carterae.1